MPSAFTIYGQLIADTGAFEQSLRDADNRLKSTTANLDKTISASNKLGDISSTVARRYEKLNDGIKTQNARLYEAADAFSKGTINAQKYASVLASVDTQTSSLNSRIKDANARIAELQETGLTHFQNQIKGAGNDLFARLSSFQKTQLSFQLNDIITGLASGQNPLRILAQQGGQVFQVFQMGKREASGMAAATELAAVSETKLSRAADAAAIAANETAKASKATADAMADASASTTLFGVPIVAAGAALAAAVVSILAVKKLSEDIRESAEKRLKNEEAITSEFNKQNQLINALKPRLASEQASRAFDKFANSDDIFGLNLGLANRQRESDSIAKEIADEQARRNSLLSALPKLGPEYLAGAASPEQTARLKQLNDEISTLTASVERVKSSATESSSDFIARVQKGQLDNLAKAEKAAQASNEAQLKAAQASENSLLKANYSVQEALLNQHLKIQQASEFTAIQETTNLKNRQLADQIASDKKYYSQLIANAKDPQEAAKLQAELADKVNTATAQMRVNSIKAFTDAFEAAKNLKKEIQSIFVDAADNKYVHIWDETARAIEHVKEVFKGLNSQAELQNEILIKLKGAAKDYAEQLSDKLAATALRQDAARYARGVNEAGYASAGAQSYAEFRQQKFAEHLFDSQGRYAFSKDDYNAQKSAFVTDYLNSIKNRQIQTNLETSLNAINAYGDNFNPNVSSAEFNFQKLQQSLPEFREKLDQKIIELTSRFDPTQLTRDQNRLAADARLDLAKIEESKRKEGVDALKANTEALQELIKKGGLKLTIDNRVPNNARVTQNPTQATTDDYYK